MTRARPRQLHLHAAARPGRRARRARSRCRARARRRGTRPSRSTTSKLVEVPKSTTMPGRRRGGGAASVFTMRSAPTSFGLSMRIGTPVRMPGSTMTIGTAAIPALAHRPHLAQRGRHGRADGDAVDWVSIARAARGRAARARRTWPAASVVPARNAHEVLAVEEPEHRVGVADVNREQHRSCPSRPQVDADVEHRGGVGERTDREVVDAGRGDVGGRLAG